MKKSKVILIVGPIASGKTVLANTLAGGFADRNTVHVLDDYSFLEFDSEKMNIEAYSRKFDQHVKDLKASIAKSKADYFIFTARQVPPRFLQAIDVYQIIEVKKVGQG